MWKPFSFVSAWSPRARKSDTSSTLSTGSPRFTSLHDTATGEG